MHCWVRIGQRFGSTKSHELISSPHGVKVTFRGKRPGFTPEDCRDTYGALCWCWRHHVVSLCLPLANSNKQILFGISNTLCVYQLFVRDSFSHYDVSIWLPVDVRSRPLGQTAVWLKGPLPECARKKNWSRRVLTLAIRQLVELVAWESWSI